MAKVRKAVRPWKHVTPAEFGAIQALKKAGLSASKIASAMQRSPSTIFYMLQHDTLEAYREAVIEKSRKAHEKQTELKQGKDVPVGNIPTGVPENLGFNPVPTGEQQFDFKLLNENLVLLANKLEGYAKSAEALTIAIYSLRKSNNAMNASRKVEF